MTPRYLRFIDVLRGEGDPDGTINVRKPDGTFVNVAPLSTLLREWDDMEAHIAKLEEFVPVDARTTIKRVALENQQANS